MSEAVLFLYPVLLVGYLLMAARWQPSHSSGQRHAIERRNPDSRRTYRF